jgi:hypothetical protein
MKFLLLIFSFQLLFSGVFAQVQLSGRVTDQKNVPLPGANVYFKNSYEGATADSTGKFNFKTNLKGLNVLTVSFIGYKTFFLELNLVLKPKS